MRYHLFLLLPSAVLLLLIGIFLIPLFLSYSSVEAAQPAKCITGFHNPATGPNKAMCVADAGNKDYPAGGVYNPSIDPQGKCVNNDGHYDATCMTKAYPPNGVAPQSGGSSGSTTTNPPPSNTGTGSTTTNPPPSSSNSNTTSNCSVAYKWVRTVNGNDFLEVTWTYPANYYTDGELLTVQSSNDSFDVRAGTRGIIVARSNVYQIPSSAFQGSATSYIIRTPGSATDGMKQCQGAGTPLPAEPSGNDTNVPPPSVYAGTNNAPLDRCAYAARPKECELAQSENHLEQYNDDICFSPISLQDGTLTYTASNGAPNQLVYPQYLDGNGSPRYNSVDCKSKRGERDCKKKQDKGFVYTYVLGSNPETSCYSFTGVITVLMQYAMLIASLICGFMFLWGGIKYTTSRGNPAALTEARDQILHATIGLVVIMTAYIIVLFLQGSLGFLGINLVGPFGAVFGTPH